MNDIVLIYSITLAFVCVMTSLALVYRYYLGNRLNKQADKLKSQMANIRRDFPDFSDNREGFVGKSLEGLGLDGILDSIGIPAIFKPIAKGFIDNMLKNPDKLKPILDKLGIVLPDGEKSKGQEGNLL